MKLLDAPDEEFDQNNINKELEVIVRDVLNGSNKTDEMLRKIKARIGNPNTDSPNDDNSDDDNSDDDNSNDELLQ